MKQSCVVWVSNRIPLVERLGLQGSFQPGKFQPATYRTSTHKRTCAFAKSRCFWQNRVIFDHGKEYSYSMGEQRTIKCVGPLIYGCRDRSSCTCMCWCGIHRHSLQDLGENDSGTHTSDVNRSTGESCRTVWCWLKLSNCFRPCLNMRALCVFRHTYFCARTYRHVHGLTGAFM